MSGGIATNGVDYTMTAGTLVFAPGEQYKTFRLNIVDDTLAESLKTVQISLSTPVNGVLGANTAYTYTIIDNDGGPVNQLPAVSITTPGSGASFTTPTNITLTANAWDGDGTVAKVEFFANGALIGTSLAAPYSRAWNNVAVGSYTLTAKATDNTGASTTSAAVSITVKASTNGNVAPSVAITKPASSGGLITAPTILTVNATASDSDGTVAKVEFFANGALFGTSLAAPYSATWRQSVPGSYTFTAKATDNTGATKTSAAVSVIVKQ